MVCRWSGEIHADFVFAPNAHTTAMLTMERGRAVGALRGEQGRSNVAGLQQASLICKNEKMREAIAKEFTSCGVKSGNVFAFWLRRAPPIPAATRGWTG